MSDSGMKSLAINPQAMPGRRIYATFLESGELVGAWYNEGNSEYRMRVEVNQEGVNEFRSAQRSGRQTVRTTFTDNEVPILSITSSVRLSWEDGNQVLSGEFITTVDPLVDEEATFEAHLRWSEDGPVSPANIRIARGSRDATGEFDLNNWNPIGVDFEQFFSGVVVDEIAEKLTPFRPVLEQHFESLQEQSGWIIPEPGAKPIQKEGSVSARRAGGAVCAAMAAMGGAMIAGAFCLGGPISCLIGGAWGAGQGAFMGHFC